MFTHHVVKNRSGARGRQARVSQTQDAIKGGIIKEAAWLGLTQTKDLVADLNICNLCRRTGRNGYKIPF